MSSMFSRKISPSRIRRITELDSRHIYNSLLEAKSKSSKIVAKLANPVDLVDDLLNGTVPHCLLDEQILVCYTVANPWYAKSQTILYELMVLRIADGAASMTDVVGLLDDLAAEAKAHAICVGGALSDRPRALSRMYQRFGYSEEDSPELVKWRK